MGQVQTINDKIAISILTLMAVFCPIIYFRAGGSTFSLVDTLSAPITAALLFKAHRIPLAYYPYAAYCAVAILSAALSYYNDSGASQAYLALRLILISSPIFLIYIIDNFDRYSIDRLYKTLVFASGTSVTIGLLLHYFGIQIQDSQQKLWLGAGLGSAARAGGLVGNSGDYGQLTALFAILLLGAPLWGARFSRYVNVTAAVVVVLALLASSSRIATLMIASAILVMNVFQPKRYLMPSIAASIVILISLYIFLLSSEVDYYLEQTLARLDFLNITGESIFFETVRVENWSNLIGSYGNTSFLGFGYKLFEDYHGYYVDNAFLLTWVETGLFGFILFLAFWLTLLFRFFAASLRGSNTALFGLSVTVAFLLRMMTSGAHAGWSSAPLIFLAIGLALRASSAEQHSSETYAHPFPHRTR